MIAKGTSKRLPGKNLKDFNGKPTIVWNLEKCLSLFTKVYVSSDSEEILKLAASMGAIPIWRDESLCGEVPDIPVFQHALTWMSKDVGQVVAVHANNPTLDRELIYLAKQFVEMGIPEVMTSKPLKYQNNYHDQGVKVNGSIRAFSRERLVNYNDPYLPSAEVYIVDDSIEIETEDSFNAALWQSEHRS